MKHYNPILTLMLDRMKEEKFNVPLIKEFVAPLLTRSFEEEQKVKEALKELGCEPHE